MSAAHGVLSSFRGRGEGHRGYLEQGSYRLWVLKRRARLKPDNSISLLYSQPVSALQILGNDGEWKWVKHVEGAGRLHND